MTALSRYVQCAGYELHFMEWGAADAPVVVAWHGLARTGRDMDALAQFLVGQGIRVICPDTIGRGFSQWSRAPKDEYCLRFYARLARELFDALGIERAHFCGASLGGMIAQHLAAMAPQRVESLTLIMTSSGAEGLPAPSAALVQLLSRRSAPNREVALEQQADLLAALGSPDIKDDRQALLHQAALSYDRAFNPEGVKRQIMAILAEPSRVPLLNQRRVPTLVEHGTADPLLPVMHGVHLAAHIQGSQLKLIPGLAHRFQEAFKAPLLAAVLPYLREHREDASHVAQL